MTGRRPGGGVLLAAVLPAALLLAGCGGSPAHRAAAAPVAAPAGTAVPVAATPPAPDAPLAAVPEPVPTRAVPTTAVPTPAVPTTPAPTTPAATPSAPRTSAGACAAVHVALELGQGSGGHTVHTLVVSNPGPRACTVPGSPGVVLVGEGAGPMGAPATAAPGAAAPAVTLAPQASARASLRITAPGLYDDQDCVAEPVEGLSVTVGATVAAVALPRGTTACSDRRVGQMTVGPLAG